jgi:hypothetical protein
MTEKPKKGRKELRNCTNPANKKNDAEDKLKFNRRSRTI